uniref:Mitochondrial dicarboxylate carrier n=1 Tax=Oncorhynchus tshawytscha TaxID=74940 RepID=A0AAZ3PRP2_ONCTS
MSEKRRSRWYFGGLSSSAAACITHPLDLIKVHLQTQHEVRMRMVGMTMSVVQREGVLALYSGLSASLCRQMTYSLSRFAIYETVSDQMKDRTHGPMPFYQKVLLGLFGGFAGGFIGTPADMVNVSYAHALDGLFRVWKEEGMKKLFSGATMASSRGALVTVGQLACYDQAKQLVLGTGAMQDNILTHFLASLIRLLLSWIVFLLFQGLLHCVRDTAKLGPNAFYKGLVPAGIRLIPHTVLTFIFLEQLRTCCGIRIVT